jgi:hypothetical protein
VAACLGGKGVAGRSSTGGILEPSSAVLKRPRLWAWGCGALPFCCTYRARRDPQVSKAIQAQRGRPPSLRPAERSERLRAVSSQASLPYLTRPIVPIVAAVTNG